MLITSKNHDVKMDRLKRSPRRALGLRAPDAPDDSGVSRRGELWHRPHERRPRQPTLRGVCSGRGAAPRFLHDVRALLDARAELAEIFGAAGQLGLVWCAPWSGATSLGFRDLDPFFIEICRRIRLSSAGDGTLVAHRGLSKAARIDGKESSGNTGDAWTPVARKDGKALTMPEAGFNYDRVQDLLFGEWDPGAAGRFDAEGGDRLWIGQVLVRGQGKTGGYHERWVPVPAKVRRSFAQPRAHRRLGERSKAWVRLAADMRLKILKPALLTLLQGAPEKLNFNDDRANAYLRRLDAAIDDDFFSLLFAHVDDSPEEADAAFQKRLVQLAEVELRRAVESLPVPSARRWRAEAKASRVFLGAARKHLALAFLPPAAASAEVASARGETL